MSIPKDRENVSDIYSKILYSQDSEDKMPLKPLKLRPEPVSCCSYKKILRKYKRQRFGGMNAVRKKVSSKHQTFSRRMFSMQGQLKHYLTGSRLSGKKMTIKNHNHHFHSVDNHALDPSGLTGTNLCTDLISEIGGELSGNRGNGNSPFNSSNSCGSPECLMTTSCNQTHKSLPGAMSNMDYKCDDVQTERDCSQCSKEQNNNSNCVCSEDNIPKCVVASSDEDLINVEETSDDEANSTKRTGQNFDTQVKNNPVDVLDLEECLDSQKPVRKNVQKETMCSPNSCQSSTSQQSSQSTSIVDWQQQFMSFLSSASKPEEDVNSHQCNKTSSQSPRKKRSRKVRHSICACCIGGSSVHGKKPRHHSNHLRKHGLTRDHKHFIRDMVQLVSLRNKVVKLFCSVFPQCRDIIVELNPDSEKVDKFIDRVIGIMETPDEMSSCGFKEINSYCPDNDTETLDMNECPRLEGPIEDNFDEKGSGEMPVLDICRYDYDEDKQHTFNPLSNENNVNKEISVISKDDMVQRTNNDAVHGEEHSEKICCNSYTSMESDGAITEDSLLLSRRLKMFSEGDSGIIKDCDTSACNVDADNSWLSSHPQNLSKNGSHASLLLCVNEKCNSHKDNLSLTNKDSCPVLSRIGEENNGVHCQNDAENDVDVNVSEVSDDDTIISDTIYPTLIDMTKDPSVGEEMDTVEQSSQFSSGQTDVGRIITHNPAYSDISEASRISCSSPSQWAVSSEEVLNSKVEKWCLNGTKTGFTTDTVADEDKEYTQYSKMFSTGNRNRTDDEREFKMDESNVTESPCHSFPKLLPSNSSTPCKKVNIIEIFDSSVELCRKPKACLKSLRKRIHVLLGTFLPDVCLGNSYFRNVDHLEYLLDAVISCNANSLE